jgi:hypothetical protein
MMRPLLLTMRLAQIVILMLWISPVTAAEVVRDDATGLTVTPPDGYVVQREAAPPASFAAVLFSLKKPLDPPPTGCTVSAQFVPASDDANSALARLLAERSREGKPSWRDQALGEIMSSVLVQSSGPYSQDGFEGLQAEGWPRQDIDGSRPAIDRTMKIRIVLLKLRSDRGQAVTAVKCRAAAADFAAKRAEFEEVVHGVKLVR